MTRLLLGVAGLALANPLAAQAARYEGEATNLGLAAAPRPIDMGVTGGLTCVMPPNGEGQLIVHPPLGGTGAAVAHRWGDSVLIVSASDGGDTIAWVGRVDGVQLSGVYVIIGGMFARQGGRWTLTRTSGPALPSGPRPGARFLGSVLAGVHVLAAGDAATTAAGRGAGPPAPLETVAPPTTTEPPSQTAFPAQSTRAPESPAGGITGDAIDNLAGFGLVSVGAFVAGAYVLSRRRTARRHPTVRYHLRCPHCNSRLVDDARRLWFLQGWLVIARYGAATVVGCGPCVRRTTWQRLAMNTLFGWWCVPWGLGTPFVMLQNLSALVLPPDQTTIDAALRAAGLDPIELRLDERGFTREQRSIAEAARWAIAAALGPTPSPVARARALTILGQFAGGRIAAEDMAAWLAAAPPSPPDGFATLAFDLRHTLLVMGIDVALAGGTLDLGRMVRLTGLADRLGFGPGAVEAILNGAFDPRAAGAREAGKTDEHARTGPRRRSGPTPDEMNRARTVLGVSGSATLLEIKQAWRQGVLRHHPDRAGPDRARQAAHLARTQELNWAYGVLRQEAEVELRT